MYLHGHGPGLIHTKKAVNKLEDLKGMKIRCTGMAAKIVASSWCNSCGHANGRDL